MSEKNIRFQAIRRLHGKAILKSWEILELLKNGFPERAFALWRGLFEITVFAQLISDKDEEVAERYLNYYIVENYRFAKRYRNYYEEAKLDEIRDQEFDAIKQMYETVLEKYGREYGKYYGWVPIQLVSKNKKDRVTFEKLKNLVQLEQWSSYYDLASSILHPSSNSLRYSIAHDSKLILVGPSNDGLADPAQSTAICLNQVTRLFNDTIKKDKNYEESKYLMILSMIVETICHTFVSIQKSFQVT